jgi:hypothetical protein
VHFALLQPEKESGMMDNPPGTSAIVEAALEETPQTLFSVADVPLARTDELLAAISGDAVRSLLEMRIEQIIKHGHTAENDDTLPLGWLPKEARECLMMACDNMWGPNRDLAVARRRFVRAGAFVLAAIDRLDREVAATGKGI